MVIRAISRAVAVVVVCSTAVSAQTLSTNVKDVKGWRTTEWGMTVEQVRTASGLALATLEAPNKERPSTKCYRDADVSVGDQKVSVIFCFDGELQGLMGTSLSIPAGERAETQTWEGVRDELVSKYGEPVSVLVGTGPVIEHVRRGRWLLPSTEIWARVRRKRWLTCVCDLHPA